MTPVPAGKASASSGRKQRNTWAAGREIKRRQNPPVIAPALMRLKGMVDLRVDLRQVFRQGDVLDREVGWRKAPTLLVGAGVVVIALILIQSPNSKALEKDGKVTENDDRVQPLSARIERFAIQLREIPQDISRCSISSTQSPPRNVRSAFSNSRRYPMSGRWPSGV